MAPPKREILAIIVVSLMALVCFRGMIQSATTLSGQQVVVIDDRPSALRSMSRALSEVAAEDQDGIAAEGYDGGNFQSTFPNNDLSNEETERATAAAKRITTTMKQQENGATTADPLGMVLDALLVEEQRGRQPQVAHETGEDADQKIDNLRENSNSNNLIRIHHTTDVAESVAKATRNKTIRGTNKNHGSNNPNVATEFSFSEDEEPDTDDDGIDNSSGKERQDTPTDALQPAVHNAVASKSSSGSASIRVDDSATLDKPSDSSLPRIVVIGIANRTLQRYLRSIKVGLRSFLKDRFTLAEMVIVPRNSGDTTVKILNSWKRLENWNVTLLPRVVGGKDTGLLRERLWEYVKETELNGSIDYVFMLDMNTKNGFLSGAEECLTSLPSTWTVCCPNSYTVYHDLPALRTQDDWVRHNVLAKSKTDANSNNNNDSNNWPYRHIPAKTDPIQVDSCFGGAALYKYSAMSQLDLNGYSATEKKDGHTVPVSEHVSFHQHLREQDPSVELYIQPRFMNDGPDGNEEVLLNAARERLKPAWTASRADPQQQEFYRNSPPWEAGSKKRRVVQR